MEKIADFQAEKTAQNRVMSMAVMIFRYRFLGLSHFSGFSSFGDFPDLPLSSLSACAN